MPCFSLQIESLRIQFSNSSEVLTCNSTNSDPLAQIKKLHVLVSTYQVVQEAQTSTRMAVGNPEYVDRRRWLDESGVKPDLTNLLTNSVYSIHLSSSGCTCQK